MAGRPFFLLFTARGLLVDVDADDNVDREEDEEHDGVYEAAGGSRSAKLVVDERQSESAAGEKETFAKSGDVLRISFSLNESSRDRFLFMASCGNQSINES